jgi:nucleotide-binding universal stress UspA family protein
MSQPQSIKTIIYATDLGEHMLPVFRRAIVMAERFEAQIVMLHVAEPLTSTGMAVVELYVPKDDYERFEHEGMQKILERMRERVSKFCQDETGSCPDDSALISDVVVAHGRPGVEIPRQAKERGADLIVMGTCSHGLLGHELLGSTARRVIHASEVPVLVVPNCNT